MTIKVKVDVKLKNIKTFRGHDGQGLNADIFINGLKCMHVFDAAYGGCFDYTNYTHNNPKEEQVKANIKYLEEYINILPEKVFSDTAVTVKMNLDMFVDELFQKCEDEKFLHNLKKNEIDHVIYGLPSGDGYFIRKYRTPLSEIPLPYLIAELNKIKINDFKKGYIFFNTNFKELGIDKLI